MGEATVLDQCKSFSDIFSLVKSIVYDFIGQDRAGMMLGLTELSPHNHAHVGAFYHMDANTIVVNTKPLNMLNGSRLYNAYVFHVLLVGYLQSFGLEADDCNTAAYEISKKYFGSNHTTTQMALNLEQFFPELTMEQAGELPELTEVEFVSGVDREKTNYIL